MSEEKEISRSVSEPKSEPESKSEPVEEIQDPTEHYRAKKGITCNK